MSVLFWFSRRVECCHRRWQTRCLPVTILMSSSWLRLLVEPSDRLELAELNGCSDGHGDDGGPPDRNAAAHPIPERRRGLYLGGPRNGTNDIMVNKKGMKKIKYKHIHIRQK